MQNSRTNRLAAAQVEYAQMGQGLLVPHNPWCCGTPGKLYKYTPMVSPTCLQGGQSSSGDTVTYTSNRRFLNNELLGIALAAVNGEEQWQPVQRSAVNGNERKTKQNNKTHPRATLTKICSFKGIKIQVSEKMENIHGKKARFSSMTLTVTAGYPWQQPRNSWVSIKGKSKGGQGPVLPVSLIIHFHVCISNWFLGCWVF